MPFISAATTIESGEIGVAAGILLTDEKNIFILVPKYIFEAGGADHLFTVGSEPVAQPACLEDFCTGAFADLLGCYDLLRLSADFAPSGHAFNYAESAECPRLSLGENVFIANGGGGVTNLYVACAERKVLFVGARDRAFQLEGLIEIRTRGEKVEAFDRLFPNSLILTKDERALGVVLCFSDESLFAVPICRLLAGLNLKLLPGHKEEIEKRSHSATVVEGSNIIVSESELLELQSTLGAADKVPDMPLGLRQKVEIRIKALEAAE